MVAAATVFVAMMLVWGNVSAAWVGLVKAVALGLSRGTAVVVSPGASIVLPVVCGAIVVVDLSLYRRISWLCVAFVVSFGVELALVAVWAVAGAPAAWIVAPGNAVHILPAIAVLVFALSEARAGSRTTR